MVGIGMPMVVIAIICLLFFAIIDKDWELAVFPLSIIIPLVLLVLYLMTQ